MFGSETLEVAIGLAVLFSFMSLFASAFRETVEAWVKQRGKLIHEALDQLFSSDPDGESPTIAQFYDSIVISPLFRGAYKGVKGELPSYITSDNFVSAIYDVARRQAGARAGAAASEWIGKIKDKRLSELVNLAFQVGGGDPEKARSFLEQWYDTQMERVSGWYKRSTHWILLGFGFVAALLLNVDSIVIVQHLYRNDAMRQVIVASAASAPNASQGSDDAAQIDGIVDELHGYGFPIGWSWTGQWPTPVPQCALRGLSNDTCDLYSRGLGAFLMLLLGWAITAFAISLGAPFWFDLLNKFMVIRSTVKPFEKSQPEGSEDRPLARTKDAGSAVQTMPGRRTPNA